MAERKKLKLQNEPLDSTKIREKTPTSKSIKDEDPLKRKFKSVLVEDKSSRYRTLHATGSSKSFQIDPGPHKANTSKLHSTLAHSRVPTLGLRRPRPARPPSPLNFSTSASLNDKDFAKLLLCKDCSVKLVRITPSEICRHTVDAGFQHKRKNISRRQSSVDCDDQIQSSSSSKVTGTSLRRCSVVLERLNYSIFEKAKDDEVLNPEDNSSLEVNSSRTMSSGAVPPLSQVLGPSLSSGSVPPLSQVSGPTLSSGSVPPLSQVSGPTLSSGSVPPLSQVSGPRISSGSVPQLSQVSVPTLSSGSDQPLSHEIQDVVEKINQSASISKDFSFSSEDLFEENIEMQQSEPSSLEIPDQVESEMGISPIPCPNTPPMIWTQGASDRDPSTPQIGSRRQSSRDIFSDDEKLDSDNKGEIIGSKSVVDSSPIYSTSDDNDQTGIKSFYGYQTILDMTGDSNINLDSDDESQRQDESQRYDESQKHDESQRHDESLRYDESQRHDESYSISGDAQTIILKPCQKAPTISEVSDSMLQSGMFEIREREEVRHAVYYSENADLAGAKSSKGVDVGKEKLKLGWERDLPRFESKFRVQPGTKFDLDHRQPSDNKTVVLECVERPPTFAEVLRSCQRVKRTPSPKKVPETSKKDKLMRPKLQLKENSEDESVGSQDSLLISSDESDNNSSDGPDVINSSQMVDSIELDRSKLSRSQLRRQLRKSNSRIISCNLTASNPQGFKTNFQNLKASNIQQEPQYLKLLSMEVHVITRGRLLPDPEYDSLAAVFYVFAVDEKCKEVCRKNGNPVRNGSCLNEGILVLDPDSKSDGESHKRDSLTRGGITDKNIKYFSEEKELILEFTKMVQQEDPDILVGYETQQRSWGFLVKRSSCKFDLNLPPMLSRCPKNEQESRLVSSAKADNYLTDPDTELVLAGRIVLNIWRLMRSEVALTAYTAENLFYHVLHERIPKFEHRTLTQWWTGPRADLDRWRVLDYYLIRTHGNLRLLDQLDVIGRTSELAKLFGIQFNEVLTRGTQFRVESIMLRLVKARNFIPVSPSIQQRAKMRAAEYLPLVMEPESRFYSDPVVVLDFQSLYPSIMMAYNYCYSTCLGRVLQHLEEQNQMEEDKSRTSTFRFGCEHLTISPERLSKLEGHLNFSPGGIAFLKPHVRKGILPKMLEEILNTRLMVKRSMKLYNQEAKKNPDIANENAALQRILHARQLGLKLIANVTYGYTSANFSGRMPCIEVGDSVVSKGRETLERAIRFIERAGKDSDPGEDTKIPTQNSESESQGLGPDLSDPFVSNQSTESEGSPKCLWPGARVVYGDTDSLFVLLPGRTRAEAFKIGQQMAEAVTKMNPKPVKLQFEKIYHPTILQTKKRYVGYMYESPDQEQPIYNAKGIETVRRDGVPAIVKMLEKSLRILFETKDVSLVKRYVQRQFSKISGGKVPLQDLTFAREFRGMAGYRPSACVPALELSKRLARFDRMSLPPQGHRVPYVIVYGEPGRPLFHSVRSPEEVLEGQYPMGDSVGLLRPNTQYYITKVIVPALARCFSLIGADVMKWFKESPKVYPRTLLMMGPANTIISATNNLDLEGQAEFGPSTRMRGRRGRGSGFFGGGQTRQGVILQYFSSSQCIVCDNTFTLKNKKTAAENPPKGSGQICPSCLEQPQKVALVLSSKIRVWDRTYNQLSRICGNCAGAPAFSLCQSFDCPVVYQRVLAEAEVQQVPIVQHILKTELLEF